MHHGSEKVLTRNTAIWPRVTAGKTKDEALRLAQIDLIRSADYSQPKDWAAFQLDGDWK